MYAVTIIRKSGTKQTWSGLTIQEAAELRERILAAEPVRSIRIDEVK